MGPLGRGAVERPRDARDFFLGDYQIPLPRPAVFFQDISAIPVKMQATYPTCGGHAGATFDSKLQTDKRGTVQDLSPKFLWKEIKLIDNNPLENGTDMRSIFKALQGKGDCKEGSMPDTLDTSLQQYSDAKVITATQLKEAAQNIIGNYGFNDYPSFEEIKQTIYQNKGALALIQVSDAFWKPSWLEKDILPLRFSTLVGGHFVFLYGYDEKFVYFRNSWGTEWGRHGDGYFDESYALHVIELGTAITLPAPYIFTGDLQYNDIGADVLQLQKRLNASPETQVAPVGQPGSLGHETLYFGSATLAAVKKYQKLNKIPTTGYVGPLTRTKLNTTS